MRKVICSACGKERETNHYTFDTCNDCLEKSLLLIRMWRQSPEYKDKVDKLQRKYSDVLK